jgi:hypothetical protein
MQRPKDQCPVRLHATGELLPSDKEEDDHARDHFFFVFLFYSPCFYPFTTNVTRALPLEAIKGEADATSKGDEAIKRSNDQAINQQQLEPTSIETTHHHHHSQETWDLLSLSRKLVTPTTSTLVQGNTNRHETHGT